MGCLLKSWYVTTAELVLCPGLLTQHQSLVVLMQQNAWQIHQIHIYYCTSGQAVQENIRFEAGSIGPTIGRANTEAENRIFSCTARPKECDNIFII